MLQYYNQMYLIHVLVYGSTKFFICVFSLSFLLSLSLILIKNLCLQIYSPFKLLVSTKLSKFVPPPMKKMKSKYSIITDTCLTLLCGWFYVFKQFSLLTLILVANHLWHYQHMWKKNWIEKRCQLTVITWLNS